MGKIYTEEELREIEKQLSCPNGEMGVKIGQSMNESNRDMIISTLKFLDIAAHETVLEIGHGACGHLDDLYKIADDITYHGLDISETMHQVAKESQSHLSTTFKLYNGYQIPYPDNSFDKIFTVNTLYFWDKPEVLINEIVRVLKPNGTMVITYAEKSFMKNLPFVADKFRLYDFEEVENLIKSSTLKIIDSKTISEKVLNKTNEMVQRVYTMVKLAIS